MKKSAIYNKARQVSNARYRLDKNLNDLGDLLTKEVDIEGLIIWTQYVSGDDLCVSYRDEFGELEIDNCSVIPINDFIKAMPTIKTTDDLPTGI